MQPLERIEADDPIVVAHGAAQHRLVRRLGLAEERRIAAVDVSARGPNGNGARDGHAAEDLGED